MSLPPSPRPPRPDLGTINLDNCDQEPIHIPGSIQSHGALFALDEQGRLSHVSRNLSTYLTSLPPLDLSRPGPPYTAILTDPALLQLIGAVRDEVGEELERGPDASRMMAEISLGGVLCDVVAHRIGASLIVEIEGRVSGSPDASPLAMRAHRGMARLRSLEREHVLVRTAVELVGEMTGFDRVMAYRFDHDHSGEVVAEHRAPGLIPYLGLHFPAADIPAQARRMYVSNTLRFITDIDDPQVPIDAFSGNDEPLDLSSAILRSVSPIHLEYLRNIDAAASMSLSVVVQGRLWGLISCHHGTPRRVPFGVRLICDALAHVLGSSIDAIGQRRHSTRRAIVDELIQRLDVVVLGHEAGHMLSTEGLLERVTDAISCDHVVLGFGAGLATTGLPATVVAPLLRWLDGLDDDFVVMAELDAVPEAVRAALHPVAGLMAMRFDPRHRAWLVLLRDEYRDTVTWSGPDVKARRVGPHGARLTAHGSLRLWREEVQGRCRPWTSADQELGRALHDGIAGLVTLRGAPLDMARQHLLGMLGHDLRDPLHSISLAAQLLERGADQVAIGHRIAASTDRMSRLVAQMLDMARLQEGQRLHLERRPTDLVAVIRSLIDENRLTYPLFTVELDMPGELIAQVDATRFSQVVSNLLANARAHGERAVPARLSLCTFERDDASWVRFEVANQAEPLGDELERSLFDPLKRASAGNPRNPGGLGLGLFIAQAVAREHGGTLDYRHEDGWVVFRLQMPRGQAGASGDEDSGCGPSSSSGSPATR